MATWDCAAMGDRLYCNFKMMFALRSGGGQAALTLLQLVRDAAISEVYRRRQSRIC